MKSIWKIKPAKKEIDITGFYSCFYVERNKNYIFSGERHNFWEILYVDQGEVFVVADETGYELKQGDIIFHKPMEYHAFSGNEKTPFNIFVTSFDCKSPKMEFFKNKTFILTASQKKILSRFIEEMEQGFEPPYDNLSYQSAVSHFELFLINIIKNSTLVETSEVSKKNIEQTFAQIIINYLENNVYTSIALADICKNFSVSKSYICKIFKEETGKSIIDYFIDLKISKAKGLIRQGELNFTQISEKLGYNSIHHFSKTFKNKTGLSPGAYVKSII